MYSVLGRHRGIPYYLGSATSDDKFLLERLDHSLRFPGSSDPQMEFLLLDIARQVLDRLYVLHKNRYIHCDIKPSNLLNGPDPLTQNTVYLIVFIGMNASHTLGKPEPKTISVLFTLPFT